MPYVWGLFWDPQRFKINGTYCKVTQKPGELLSIRKTLSETSYVVCIAHSQRLCINKALNCDPDDPLPPTGLTINVQAKSSKNPQNNVTELRNMLTYAQYNSKRDEISNTTFQNFSNWI